MTRRIARASLLAMFVSLCAVAAQASYLGPPPVVQSLSNYVVSAGQVITINGQNLANSLGGCTAFGKNPTIFFHGLEDSVDHPGVLQGTGPPNCTNTSLRVAVPAGFVGGATVAVVDNASPAQRSNSNLEVTIQPVAAVAPASGAVGSQVSINAQNGTDLRPPTAAPNAGLTLSLGGSQRFPSTWTNGSIAFTPGNSTGDVQFSFPVSTDLNDLSNPAKVVTVGVDAGTFTFLPPSASTGPITGKLVGDRLALDGANLGSGGSVLFPGGVSGQAVSWSAAQVGVTVPPGAQPGAITLNVAGYGNIPGPTITLNPLVKGLSPTSGSEGTAATITGFNFGSATGTVTSGGIAEQVTSWADQSIKFLVSGDTDTGAVSIARADGVIATAPNLSIVPRIDKLETDNVRAGSQVVVDGVSLGSAPGTAQVGGGPAQALLWSRTSALVALPTTIKPGQYPLLLTSAGGAVSNALTITIAPGPAASPSGPTGAGGHNPSAFIDNNHQFHKPPKSDSPVQLTLTANPHKTGAGGTADLSITLTLNGKPVSGAEIKLRMLFSPGSDYLFTPASGITDHDGKFEAKVRISKVNGDSIVQAESGVFSDQDHVLGTGGAAPLSTSNPANTGGIVPLVALGILALLLLGVGVWLNLRSVRASAS